MSALLDARDVRVAYTNHRTRRRAEKEILHGVSLHVNAGETLGLVGGSGSGKSTMGKAILGLVRLSGGTITFDGVDLTAEKSMTRLERARNIQVVFQDPYSSLNPSLSVSDILSEPLVAQGRSSRDARRHVQSLLDRVALPSDAAGRQPREFSGGQRQRIAIARALAMKPRLIVCDEPVSALDLATQSRVIDLLIELQRDTGVAYLFVSHDLSVIRAISHRVAVMLDGSIVETGTTGAVVNSPTHPYTQQLLLSTPAANPELQAQRRARRLSLRNV